MSAFDDYLSSIDAMTEKLLNPMNVGNSQQQWEDKPKIGGNQFLGATGRIDAGIGTGDKAQRDSTGNITGYSSVNRGSLTPGLDRQKRMQANSAAGVPLASVSGTPGLDAFHAMNPGTSFSWTKPAAKSSAPFSVRDRVGGNPADLVNRIFT